MARQLLIEKTLFFTTTCNDCLETHIEYTWAKARAWLFEHRKRCQAFQLYYKSISKGRGRTGEFVICPVCHEGRYLQLKYIITSKQLNAEHPELIGIHRICRMKVIKPALKMNLIERRSDGV